MLEQEGKHAAECKTSANRALPFTKRRRGGVVSLDDLSKVLGVSIRTLYNDVNAINDCLAGCNVGALRVASRSVDCGRVDWSRVSELALTAEGPTLSAENRRIMMLLGICCGSARTIPSLIEAFEISRNTVISDIREIKGRVRTFGAILESAPGKGYCVFGDEREIREILWNDLQTLRANDCLGEAKTLLQHALVNKSGEEIDFYELCRCLVMQYEVDLGTRVFLDGDGLDLLMIQISWLRSLDGYVIEMGREEQATLISTLSYRSVQCSAAKMRQAGLIVPDQELLYITSLLLGIKIAGVTRHSDEDAHVSRLAERLAVNFERVSCLNYVDRSIVCQQMSNHIRPLYYRLKYGLQADNPLVNDIRRVYPMSFEFTRRAAIETGLGELSDDELGYLTIYLTAGLDRKMFEEGDTSSENVLIIGAESNATIELIKRQILEACGISFNYTFLELKKVRRWELDRYALVLSLVRMPPQMRQSNVVEAEPFLTGRDFKRIFKVLHSNRIISGYQGMIDEVIDIFKENLPSAKQEDFDSDRLFFELFRYFSKKPYETSEKLPQLDVRSVIEGVTTAPTACTWQDAIRCGCEAICERTGSRTLGDRMNNLVQSPKIQWYRMTPEIVLVHCPMQGDEHGLITAEAVDCPGGGVQFPDQRMASAIICLTTIDRYSHWSALYSIYKGMGSLDSIFTPIC